MSTLHTDATDADLATLLFDMARWMERATRDQLAFPSCEEEQCWLAEGRHLREQAQTFAAASLHRPFPWTVRR